MNEEAERKTQTTRSEYGDRQPRFLELVLSVGAGALQSLGLGLPDKEGEEKGPNLELAHYSIDMLELLKEKTRGNLEEEEERFLTEMLHQLRLKYVEVANQAKEAK